MRKLLSIIAFSILAACSGDKEAPAPNPSAAAETVRQTAQGKVIGFVAENGTHVWRGLPFAASTGGENRWRAPRPAAGWDGTREAIEFGDRCTQMSNRLNEGEGIEPGLVLGSDDCLTLNIYAPADAEGKELPVMVWIHGGSNVWGWAGSYDGSNLARNENVIIVTIQYRLGPLGWFAHQAIRDSAQTPEDMGANFATLDMIASLAWVRDNITAFGGDAGNVTIFGESAGGHNVASLLASPLAEGLFHRAIIQSGSFDSMSLADAEENDPMSSSNIADKLNAQTASELRSVPNKAFLKAHWVEPGYIESPRIIEDGVVLPDFPMREAFSSTETFNNVPIITGTNRDEMKFFYIFNPELVNRFLGIFFVVRDQELYDAASEYSARVWRVRSVDGPASMMASAGHEDVYAYRFDWDEGGRFLFTDFSKLFGAAHALEIPFVFNRFRLLGDADALLFQEKTAESREQLSRAMGEYWATFARSGVPTSAGSPDWPVYAGDTVSLMRFDSVNDRGIEVITGADDISSLIADLKTDDRADNSEKCRIGQSLVDWVPVLQGEIFAELNCS